MKSVYFFEDTIQLLPHSATKVEHLGGHPVSINEFANGEPVGLYELENGELLVKKKDGSFIEGPEFKA